jgi:hypothetical protein
MVPAYGRAIAAELGDGNAVNGQWAASRGRPCGFRAELLSVTVGSGCKFHDCAYAECQSKS